MTDTITRWECLECGRKLGNRFYAGHRGPGRMSKLWCESGVPVARIYVAMGALADKVIDAMIENDGGLDSIIERRVRAAIAAVTGEAVA